MNVLLIVGALVGVMVMATVLAFCLCAVAAKADRDIEQLVNHDLRT